MYLLLPCASSCHADNALLKNMLRMLNEFCYFFLTQYFTCSPYDSFFTNSKTENTLVCNAFTDYCNKQFGRPQERYVGILAQGYWIHVTCKRTMLSVLFKFPLCSIPLQDLIFGAYLSRSTCDMSDVRDVPGKPATQSIPPENSKASQCKILPSWSGGYLAHLEMSSGISRNSSMNYSLKWRTQQL